MAKVFEFDCVVHVRTNYATGQWLATSPHIPLSIVAESEGDLKRRVDEVMAAHADYLGKRYTSDQIERYLATRGIVPDVYTQDEEPHPTVTAHLEFVAAGAR